MLQFDRPNQVAFITSYPERVCPIAAFTSHLVESMISASGETLEPVLIAVQSDVSRDYSEDVNFVIRKGFRSDYMEAADFINAGHGDVVVVQHHFDIFGEAEGSCLGDLLKRLEAPVMTTLHDVPGNLPSCHLQALHDVCDASLRVVVKNKHDLELLNKLYGIPLGKIDLILDNRLRPDYLFNQQEEWFQIGRQYWLLVSEQLCQAADELPSSHAAKEHSLLYWE